MKEIIALLFFVCSAISTFYLAAIRKFDWKITMVFLVFTLIGGLSIANYDIIKKIKWKDVEIETFERQVTEVKGQALDEIRREAADAKRLAEELSRKNEVAEKKLKELDSAVKNSSSVVEELQAYTKFNSTVLAAQSDNRPAFDQLVKWAKDKSRPFSVAAEQAWVAVMDSHESPFMSSGFKVPWKEGVDPSKFSLSELKTNFLSTPQPVRLAILEYIWHRQDFPKKERMAFLVDVMHNDTSLQIVEYAARYFKEESKDNFKNLYIDGHIKWWEESNK